MKRYKISKRRSRRLFRRTAGARYANRVKLRRGGIRL